MSEEEKLLEYIKGEQNTIEERPNFNINVPIIEDTEPAEYKVSDIMSDYSEEPNENENGINFNDIIPFILKSFKNIYKDLLLGKGISSFTKEDRLIGILLIFSFIGIYFTFKTLKNKY